MNAEEFKKAVAENSVNVDVAQVNANHRMLVNTYIDDNSPYRVGIPYLLEDCGTKVEFEKHVKKNRAFVIDMIDVERMPNGDPIIMAHGNIFVNGDHSERLIDIIGTFKCIIHGSMTQLKFKKYDRRDS